MEWIEVAKTIAELGIMIVCSALVVTIFWLNYKRGNNKDDKKDDNKSDDNKSDDNKKDDNKSDNKSDNNGNNSTDTSIKNNDKTSGNDKDSLPKTGDYTNILLYALLMTASGTGVYVIYRIKRKKDVTA